MTQKKTNSVADVAERVGVSGDYIRKELFVGRRKKSLGDTVGVTHFGVNHTTLEAGAQSALRHWHEGEDEFIYVLSGELTLVDDNGPHVLKAQDFSGFPAGDNNAHYLVNNSSEPACYMEIGSRRPGNDTIHYPDDDFGPISH